MLGSSNKLTGLEEISAKKQNLELCFKGLHHALDPCFFIFDAYLCNSLVSLTFLKKTANTLLYFHRNISLFHYSCLPIQNVASLMQISHVTQTSSGFQWIQSSAYYILCILGLQIKMSRKLVNPFLKLQANFFTFDFIIVPFKK